MSEAFGGAFRVPMDILKWNGSLSVCKWDGVQIGYEANIEGIVRGENSRTSWGEGGGGGGEQGAMTEAN